MLTIHKLIKNASSSLNKAYIDGKRDKDNFKLIASHILAHCLNKDISFLYTFSDEKAPSNFDSKLFESLLIRSCEGEPLAYILGYQDFYNIRLKVSKQTLIPRPETEEMVDFLIKKLSLKNHSYGYHILDLGSGTGAIALSLAKELPNAQILCTDIDENILQLICHNAESNKIDLSRISTSIGYKNKWFSNINSVFDLIVSNPPYIEESSPHLKSLKYEPLSALVAEEKGLSDIQNIIQNAPTYLSSYGLLAIEHGYNQQKEVIRLLRKRGFYNIVACRDSSDLPRFVVASNSQNIIKYIYKN